LHFQLTTKRHPEDDVFVGVLKKNIRNACPEPILGIAGVTFAAKKTRMEKSAGAEARIFVGS
jgi:hypothetical protein